MQSNTTTKHLEGTMSKEKQSSKYSKVCASCNKDLMAGAFPKWFCLHKECVEYLKPKN